MSLFEFNPFRASEELTPSQLRGSKMMAWLRVLLRPMKWLSDLFTDDFCKGSNAAYYDNAYTYVLGDRVRWSDRGVYELKVSSSTGVDPTGEALSRTNWMKILENYKGVDSRILWNSQRIVFEEVLNEWYGITAPPYIYLDQSANGVSTNSMDIYFPAAVFNTLGSTFLERQQAVQNFAKRYTLSSYAVGCIPY